MFKVNTKFILLQAISVLLIFTNNAFANVENSMESFWNGLGDNVNYTSGGAYKSQTTNYYSGPSIVARSKVVNVNPVTISPPRIRAGCNGIDMFTGSFSHINSDQFVALIKQIPNNAKGYIIQLALETMSPTISTQIKSIMATLEKINAMNINSCDIAKGAVNGVVSLAKGETSFCKMAQAGLGSSDFASATQKCGAEGGTTASIKNNTDQSLESIKPSDVNFAWEALSKSDITNTELKEAFQGISGTIIKKLGADDNTPSDIIYKPSKATDKEFLESMLNGGKLKTYKCDEMVKCLNLSDQTININQTNGLKSRVKNLLNSITDKLVLEKTARKVLSKDEKDLVDKVSTIPIISSLKVNVLNFGLTGAKMQNDALADMIAVELLYIYIEEVFLAIGKGMNGVKKGEGPEMEKFVNAMTTSLKHVSEQRRINLERISLTIKFINQVHDIEKVLSLQGSGVLQSFEN